MHTVGKIIGGKFYRIGKNLSVYWRIANFWTKKKEETEYNKRIHFITE